MEKISQIDEKIEEPIEEKVDPVVEPVAVVAEMKATAKNIITGLVATGVIAGGLIVGFSKDTPKMTYDEAQKLIEVYDHELKKSTSKDLTGVNKDNVIEKLNEKFSKRAVVAEENLEGEKINPEDYKILRSGLMEKTK